MPAVFRVGGHRQVRSGPPAYPNAKNLRGAFPHLNGAAKQPALRRGVRSGGGHGHAFDIAHGPAGTPHGGPHDLGELSPELVKLPLAAIDGAEIAARGPPRRGRVLEAGEGADAGDAPL